MFKAMIEAVMSIVTSNGYYPDLRVIESVQNSGEKITIAGREYINMSSNNYLGLSLLPEAIEAGYQALQTYGYGSGGSRFTSGNLAIYRALEQRIAAFEGTEDAVVFSSGFLANEGIIQALVACPIRSLIEGLDSTTVEQLQVFDSTEVFLDKLVHRSIISGIEKAISGIFSRRPKVKFFAHRDMEDLRRLLSESKASRKLIVTDGVFSLHGRFAPLDQMAKLAQEYGADIYVDDAHATGIFGEKGTGTPEHFGVKTTFHMGTLSKALSGEGGFIAADKVTCDYLRIASPTYMYQTGMSPASAASLIAAIDAVEKQPERRHRLLKLAAQFRERLTDEGFDIFGSETPIIPVRFHTEERAKRAATILFEQGIYAPAYYYPAVGKDEAMVRLNIMSAHTDVQLEQTLKALKLARGLSTSTTRPSDVDTDPCLERIVAQTPRELVGAGL